MLNGDINAVDKDGMTKLEYASYFGHYGMVAKLLERGCKVNVKTSPSFTALHYATCFGHYEIVKILLQHGINPNIQEKMGKTALHFALEGIYNRLRWKFDPYEYVSIVQILLNDDNDMDINIKNKIGKTGLQLAIELSLKNKQFTEIARMIAKKACLKPRISDSIYPLKHLI